MGAFLSTTILGLLIAIMGIINMTGNISSLHWYHRQRVTEEDRRPFGKQVGLGSLICGVACIFFGVMFLIHELTALMPFVWVGTVGIVAGLAGGIIIMLKAILKYNKGLF